MEINIERIDGEPIRFVRTNDKIVGVLYYGKYFSMKKLDGKAKDDVEKFILHKNYTPQK